MQIIFLIFAYVDDMIRRVKVVTNWRQKNLKVKGKLKVSMGFNLRR